jgi:hypothetical protein
MSKEAKDPKDMDPRLFDQRNLERNIKRGLFTRKEYEKYLKGLPDARDKAAKLVETVDDDDDDEA